MRLCGRQRPLRVADHLVPRDRDERRLRVVARPGHVVGDPVVERLNLGVFLAGDVRDAFSVHLVDPADELGALRPRDDRDSFGRIELEQRREEIELDLEGAADLGEAAALGEGEARLVAELASASSASPPFAEAQRESAGEQRGAEPAASVRERYERPDSRLGLPRVPDAETGRDERAVLEGEQVRCPGSLPLATHVLDRDLVVGEHLVADREPALELGVVAGGVNLGHAARIRPGQLSSLCRDGCPRA